MPCQGHTQALVGAGERSSFQLGGVGDWCGGGPHIEVMPGLIFTPARAAAVLLAFCCAHPAHAQFSNNPCDQPPPEDVTCAMGMEELCKGTFSLWAMYAGKLGSPPDDDMTCCTASVFSAECTGVWCVLARCRCAPQVTCVSSCPSVADPMRWACSRGMMQVLNTCPTFRQMRHSPPADTDTNPSIAHEVCDACLYETPGDLESREYVAIPAPIHLPPQCCSCDTPKAASLAF